MTKISAFPALANPTEDDILIGTDVNGSDETRNFSIRSIIDLIGDINQGPIGNPVIKVVKTTITQAQILQLFTTPITILESLETGKAKMPLNILCKRSAPGTNYTISAN